MEDLTALNVATLNHLKNNNLVDKCWSWNGQLLATLRDSKKIMVKRYQPVQKATVVNYVNHVSDSMYYWHLTTVSCGGIWTVMFPFYFTFWFVCVCTVFICVVITTCMCLMVATLMYFVSYSCG